MKKVIIAATIFFYSCSPALYVNHFDNTKKYQSISANDVKIFLSEKELPPDYERIAIIEIKNADSDSDSYGDMRKEASRIGCNGIIQLEEKSNGNISLSAPSLFNGVGLNSKANIKFLAFRFPVDGKYPKHVKHISDDMYNQN